MNLELRRFIAPQQNGRSISPDLAIKYVLVALTKPLLRSRIS